MSLKSTVAKLDNPLVFGFSNALMTIPLAILAMMLISHVLRRYGQPGAVSLANGQ